ncbi:uncharacterized protein N7484_011858 [Penicillium longicatenatum]|uniref:uncharacterized protein n=1 Tax=Penicillium longicatenatum TaxID=1561947 RepID=UPI0025485851|nr:uncharacterized protein N7484_011858 [Penicillium longicatenatum]KAJ5631758.1 hypothetical protein N7484_011858 [Penicillium longicatenatum]
MRNSQRRRVPVACRRCRKRKIKCSGDSGDGQGCSNCRSAGTNDCQFFRVNSHSVNSHVVTSHAVNSHKTSTAWQPYPHVGTTIAPSTQLGMLPQQPSYKSSHISMGSPQTRMATFPYPLQQSPDYDLSSADAHIFEQSINYTQSPSYAPSGALMEYNTPVWSPKGWDSMFSTGRAPNGNLYPDSEASLNQFAYMLPSQAIPSDMSQSASSATTTVSSADTTSGPDRTLPTPTSRGQQAPSAGFLPDGTWASDYKASFWTPRQADSQDQRPNSTHTVPSNAPFTSSPPHQHKYVSIKNNTPDMLFPYLPIPTTTEDTNTTSAPTISGNTAYPVLALDPEYPVPTRLARSSRDHSAGQQLLALTNECSSDMYGYSTSGKSKRGSRDDSRVLLSGLPYTRVQHRDTPGTAFPFNLGPDSLPEYHRAVVENVHRPPVEPLGNQGY